MKANRNNLDSRSCWIKIPILSGQYHPWLIERGSLTLLLQNHFSSFTVKPMVVGYIKPLLDEVFPLKIGMGKTALIREVLLIGNNQAVVFAHSVLPRNSLRGSWKGLRELGAKPLGATLFANPRVKRTALSYKKLYPQHLLYQRAAKGLKVSPPSLWARRSIFSFNCAKIMVTEVFLPELLIS